MKKSAVSGSPKEVRERLMRLAEEGTIESVEKIREIVLAIEDGELFDFATLVYDEALYNTFMPKTSEEERAFIFGRMIHRAEERIFDLVLQREDLEKSLIEDDIARAVHTQVMHVAGRKEKEAWKFHWNRDLSHFDRSQLADVTEVLAYSKAWVEQAKALFPQSKYNGAPGEIYEAIHLAGEAGRDAEA